MSKGIIEVLTKEQATLVEQIKSYHEAFEKSFSDQMGYAFLAGYALNAAKESLPHGKFTDWRAANLPEIPERSAQRYMKFADQIRHTVADLPTVGKLKLLGNGDLNEKDKEKVLEAVHEIADGKTLTQLYRDLGVIREKKAPKHHPRKPLSPEDHLEADKEQARGVMRAMLGPIATFLIEPGAVLVQLSKGERQQLLDTFISAANEVRKFQKGK